MRSVKIQFVSLVLALFTFISPLHCYAWNAVGHMVIANIAYERLKPEVRAKVDKLTADLSKEYPTLVQFQQLAPWADALRGQKIDSYTHWHYIDNAISGDGTPLKDLTEDDNVVWALNRILPVISNNSANPFERARFLAFLIHFEADVHQPLHTVSRITSAHPDGDRGGNLYLIPYKSVTNSRQMSNLHSLWDSGVGFFSGEATQQNVSDLTRIITTQYPESYFGDQINNLKPEDWASEGLKLATTVVYNTPERQIPSTAYVETGKQAAEQRTALAGYRLAALLNKLLA